MKAKSDETVAGTIFARVEQFLQELVLPLEPQFLSAGFDAVRDQLDQVRTEARKAGLWVPPLAAAHGGLGLSLYRFAPISALLGQSPLGHYALNCQAPDIGNMELLARFGSADQRRQYLEPLVAGQIRSCFTMTEPEYAGSNPVQLGATAVRDGDDFVINGHKWFATGAEGAAFAIAMVTTDPQAESAYERASLIIVPTGSPGFEHVRRIVVMGDDGTGPFSHSEVVYRDCRVPATNLLGTRGAGFALAQQRLGPGRIHHCMRWIGVCERAFDLMCRRAMQRELAPGKPLASRQTIQNWIAELRTEIDAARLLVMETARRIDADGARAVRREISQIKFHVAALMQRVLDHSIQVHGAAGLTDDTVLSHWYRHERGARIYDGPDEVHKSVVSRLVLREIEGKPVNDRR